MCVHWLRTAVVWVHGGVYGLPAAARARGGAVGLGGGVGGLPFCRLALI